MKGPGTRTQGSGASDVPGAGQLAPLPGLCHISMLWSLSRRPQSSQLLRSGAGWATDVGQQPGAPPSGEAAPWQVGDTHLKPLMVRQA